MVAITRTYQSSSSERLSRTDIAVLAARRVSCATPYCQECSASASDWHKKRHNCPGERKYRVRHTMLAGRCVMRGYTIKSSKSAETDKVSILLALQRIVGGATENDLTPRSLPRQRFTGTPVGCAISGRMKTRWMLFGTHYTKTFNHEPERYLHRGWQIFKTGVTEITG